MKSNKTGFLQEKKEVSFDVYTELNMPQYGKVEIIEGKGIHLFNAMSTSKCDSGLLIKHLVLQLVLINGVFIKEELLDNMILRDVNYIQSVISMMMENTYHNGI